MDRRDFVKSVGAASMLAALGDAWFNRAMAAEPVAPMGKPMGSGETLLVTNARLIDVAAGALFAESAIVIRGGKIDKRLSTSDAEGFKADRKIDAGGRFVIPGIINAHCHITMPGVQALGFSLFANYEDQLNRNCVDCITNGVTTVRDQAGRQPSILKRQELMARGRLLGPRILRGIAVDVPHGYMASLKLLAKDGVILGRNVSEIEDAVTKAVDRGADHIKVAMQYTSLFEDEKPIQLMTDEMYASVVKKAASLGKTVAVHHTSLDGFRKSLKSGIQSFEHMSSDRMLTDTDIRQFIDARRVVVPTGSVAWAYVFPKTGDASFDSPIVQKIWKDKQVRIAEIIDEYSVPAIAKLAKNTYKEFASPGYFDKKRGALTPSARFFNSAGAIGGANMMLMYNAGCRMGCGNDGGIPFTWPGSMPVEMALNQEAGMKPADVLRSATLVNSENIGMTDSLGTLDAGKIADIVFLDANPLESMYNMTGVAGVLQSGRLVYSKGKVTEA